MRPLPLLPALAATLLLPLAAAAQSIPSPYRFIEARQEAGFFAGWVDQDPGQVGVGPGAGPIYGAKYSIELAGPMSLEGVAAANPTTREVLDPRRLEGNRLIGEEDALLLSADARFKLALNGRRTWYGIGPYLMAGGGAIFDAAGAGEVDGELLSDDRFGFRTSFLGLLGAGVRILPGDRLQFRVDADSRFYKLTTPRGWGDSALELGDIPPDEWVRGTVLTFGAALRF